MSYDLDLFVPQSNANPISIIQEAALSKESAQTPLNLRIARRLEADNPKFHVKSTEDFIEIMDDVEGIRIHLYSNGGHISIPYWFTDDEIIALAFETTRQYLGLVLRIANYQVYDPQLGRVVNLENDLPTMIAAYKQTIRGMHSFLG